MPFDFDVDLNVKAVFTWVGGPLTAEMVEEHMRRVKANAGFDPRFNQVLDFRDMTEVLISNDRLTNLAAMTLFAESSRRAFIVDSDLHFGLARMFGAYREIHGEPSIAVVRSLLKASVWVDITEDVIGAALLKLKTRNAHSA